MIEYDGGALRSELKPRYDLIPKEALDEYARRFSLGADKYGANQWMKGDEKFFRDCINHAYAHLACYANGDYTEDTAVENLAAVMWNAGAVIWALKNNKIKPPMPYAETNKQVRQDFERGLDLLRYSTEEVRERGSGFVMVDPRETHYLALVQEGAGQLEEDFS